jgi:hypothetical protein
MDPYLETPDLWGDVHHGLIHQVRARLNAILRPRYVARIQVRVYISDEEDLIDEEIEEARIEIRHLPSKALVTVIEMLSPTNKIRGSRGRASFMDKRCEVLASDVHWVEIDLLRAGDPSVTPPPIRSDYRVLVSRAGDRRNSKYWPFDVRQPLPPLIVPLRKPDSDITLDLGAVLAAVYHHGAYDRSIDYREGPDPPLSAEDAAWADQLLRKHRLR